ncbi:LOW QUALITY PROTEIN: mannose-6-phosphate isomerase 1-like [Argentina anserina]|uniref:LOW QUALITY PROTEIN: mannose-6-phosphate isomerase 1-like n=1 Tax=Argentina anserina TaxID=57926 RepID=UPI002176833E|nr:LOW QUALITY PROTEIN: mannose-6-phosphate isomerase 1-like [Potentilla anserina]
MEMQQPKQRQRSVQRLRCSVMNYDWGKKGRDSVVGRLCASNSHFEIDQEKPYAEMWMGTHDSGLSFLIDQDLNNSNTTTGASPSLNDWIFSNPNDMLGHKVVQKWGSSDLPFLFEVQSVAKALSIQAHPDKELAKALHKSMPNIYMDDNYKPEMALALTHFQALCGYITFEELKKVIGNVPEIEEMVGSEVTNQVLRMTKEDWEDKVKSVLRLAFTQLMSTSMEMITTITTKLKCRLHTGSQVRQLTEKEQLVLQLEKQYPNDVGVISAFFLNYVKLDPGEALCLGANEPHAYISGDCIECMATSDNVVRAGLTPKHRDIKTLCSMLTYNQGLPDILRGFAVNSHVTRYIPPFEEFEVDRFHLPNGESTEFPAVPGPSIFVATLGKGSIFTSNGDHAIIEGDVLFAPAHTDISITSTSELHIYRAGVNSTFLAS